MSLSPLLEPFDPDFEGELDAVDIADAQATAERGRLRWVLLLALGLLAWDSTRGEFQGGDLEELSAQTRGRLLAMLEQKRPIEAFAAELRRGWVTAAAFGRGGFEALTASDLGQISELMRREFGFFADTFEAWRRGEISEAEMRRRLDMYANHLQTPYWEGNRGAAAEMGRSRERRRLGIAEHCGDCVRYESLGWQPLGTLPAPGEGSQCLSNCKCRLEFA